MAHAGTSEIQGGRASQSPGPYDQDTGRLQFLLPLDADFWEKKVAAVSLDLFVCQFRSFMSSCHGVP